MMNKIVELPLTEPLYRTYHRQGISGAILMDNPSIRNWYLNEVLILTCNRKFLSGFTTPELDVLDSGWKSNPYFEKKKYPMQHLDGYIHYVIKKLLDQGYYVCFTGLDDYYVQGKSWYKEKHFSHDGAICGYNRENKTYCFYAYDSNWLYQKFWTPQKCFDAGKKSIFKEGRYGFVCGIKTKNEEVAFSSGTALKKIAEYLDYSTNKFPEEENGLVYGIAVHDFIAKYVMMLFDGSIPYDKMDRRIFRLIWEHKKVMLERIQRIELELHNDSTVSSNYVSLVNEANTIRMLYASHHMKRRDSVLPIIHDKLLEIKNKETALLKQLLISNVIGDNK